MPGDKIFEIEVPATLTMYVRAKDKRAAKKMFKDYATSNLDIHSSYIPICKHSLRDAQFPEFSMNSVMKLDMFKGVDLSEMQLIHDRRKGS